MLEVKNLSVSYGEHAALENVSFSVNEGEWLMLSGPNGAGKSTALEAISQGVAYTGTVLFDGSDVSKMKPAERAERMGVLSQSNGAAYEFTVGEIVRLGRYTRGRDEGAVDAALELTNMSAFRARPINTLSGGEVQRAFLAQLFAQDPRLLMLDEPTSHLDVGAKKQIYELTARWLKQPGRSVLAVEHDLSCARLYGTRALLLANGKVAACGSPAQALCAANLRAVYGCDVTGYTRELLSAWE